MIDGSGSISTEDWQLQIGAYQSIFQNGLYTNYIEPSPFDDLSVAAYVFSDAFAFGAPFAGLPQPAGTTATAAALNVATGLLDSAFNGDTLVIDISPNAADRTLAIAAVDAAREAGITANAIGVGPSWTLPCSGPWWASTPPARPLRSSC